MNRPTLPAALAAGLAAAILAAPVAPAAPPAPAPHAKFTAPKVNDAFEVLVYTSSRPVRVRVATLAEGKSADALWRERLKKLFDFCDRDGDGSLSAKEAKSAFSDQGMMQLLVNGYYQPGQGAAPAFAELDRDGDGKASFEEFAASYKRSATQLLRALPVQPDSANGAAVTEAIFKLLDADGDGKLTEDEVKAAEKFIASHDADEDECLSVSELLPGTPDPRDARLVELELQRARLGGYAPPRPGTPQLVHVYEAGRVPGTVTQQVIKRYDRDGDFELTRAEVGFDEATFKALDADGNGRLDGEELDAWRTGAPDLELTLSAAPKPADCKAEVKGEVAAEARGFKLKRMGGGRLILHVGRQSIDFSAFSSGTQFNQASLKQQYGYLFAQAAKGKAHVVEKDLTGPNAVQFQFVRAIFDVADRDSDSKLTKAEFDAYFDIQDGFRNLSLGLTPGVQTPSLFQLLDENGDGRLGVRELRTAWPRLLALEESDVGVVTRNIIQPSVTLRLARATDRFYVNQANLAIVRGQTPYQPFVPAKGPLWFRKMDRNGDGDVSHAEYLGAKSEFDAIDTDRDDLISLEEAEAWDQKAREKEKADAKPETPGPERKKDEK